MSDLALKMVKMVKELYREKYMSFRQYQAALAEINEQEVPVNSLSKVCHRRRQRV